MNDPKPEDACAPFDPEKVPTFGTKPPTGPRQLCAWGCRRPRVERPTKKTKTRWAASVKYGECHACQIAAWRYGREPGGRPRRIGKGHGLVK